MNMEVLRWFDFKQMYCTVISKDIFNNILNIFYKLKQEFHKLLEYIHIMKSNKTYSSNHRNINNIGSTQANF